MAVKEKDADADTDDMVRDKILLRRKLMPKRVTLPNGRSFVARYERVSRKKLPRNVTINKAWTIGPRQQRKRKTQQGTGILGSVFNLEKNLWTSGTLKKGFHLGSKAISSGIGKKIIDERIKLAPDLYNYGTKKVKNINFKKTLESGIANYAVKKAQKNLFNWQNV